jgi:phosphoribosylformylglycinamidine synthase
MKLLHLYRTPALPQAKKHALLSAARQNGYPALEDIETEYCFNIETTAPLLLAEIRILRWLLAETFEPENLAEQSFLISNPPSPPFHKVGESASDFPQEGKRASLSDSSLITHQCIIEVGPRMNFTTAWSTNAVSVCHACGL